MIPSVGIPRAEGVGIVLPAVTTVLLALVGVVPLHIPGYAAVVPAFTLMGVFHWTLYRPDLLPPTVIFLIGLFLDLLTGAHFPGVSPFVLLLGHAIVEHNRKLFVGRPFPFVWGGFALTAAASVAALWGLNSMLETTLLDARLSAFRWVLSIAFYPAASYLLTRVQRAVLPA